LSKEAYNNKG